MDIKRVEPLVLELDGNEYTIDFNLETAKALALESKRSNGHLMATDVILFGLRKNHTFIEVSERIAEKIYFSLKALDDNPESDYNFDDMFGWIMQLHAQAFDEPAMAAIPAKITINKDYSVTVEHNGKKYLLTFTRAQLNKGYKLGNFDFNFDNKSELYFAGLDLVTLALNNETNGHYSSRLPTELFHAMWANLFNEETQYNFVDALVALVKHAGEVMESGTKNSSAIIKVKSKMTTKNTEEK